jgi:hypothetical protein
MKSNLVATSSRGLKELRERMVFIGGANKHIPMIWNTTNKDIDMTIGATGWQLCRICE